MHGQGGRPGGIVVLALTRGGCALGERLAAELGAEFRPCRGRVAEEMRLAWQGRRALVCIMAAGIVVRTIAPLLADKHRDPAVVVCDEAGQFAISLVSGHIGGPNALAREVNQAHRVPKDQTIPSAMDALGQSDTGIFVNHLRLDLPPMCWYCDPDHWWPAWDATGAPMLLKCAACWWKNT